MECLPGEEVQVDFGEMFILKDGKKLRKAHILRMTLSYSRKSYSEAVKSQSLENFIRAIENGFRYFGGVPEMLCLDNLKAGVKRSDWFDPELNPKFYRFCRHYNVVPVALRPYQPHHKGKVESGIKYVKNNALKGRKFDSLASLNAHLKSWECKVADTRIHGSTKQIVGKHFDAVEKSSLKGLPDTLFPLYEECLRSVQKDCYVQVKGAFYRLPSEFIYQQVWVQWTLKTVSFFSKDMSRKIRVHCTLERGQRSDCLGVQGSSHNFNNARAELNKIRMIGPHAHQWGINALQNRPDFTFRGLKGLLALQEKYSTQQINEAAYRCILQAKYRLKDVRTELQHPSTQSFIDYSQKDPCIRPLSEYHSLLEEVSSQGGVVHYQMEL
jgi:hypothetical protein